MYLKHKDQTKQKYKKQKEKREKNKLKNRFWKNKVTIETYNNNIIKHKTSGLHKTSHIEPVTRVNETSALLGKTLATDILSPLVDCWKE